MKLFTDLCKATAITLLMAVALGVKGADRPVIRTQVMHSLATQALSDNGLWALAWGAEDEQLSPVLINIATNERITLQSDADIAQHGGCFAYDITDDGNIIVGQHSGRPAYLNRQTGEWTYLPCSLETGTLRAVTPDGHYAVGSVCIGDVRGIEYTHEEPAIWDLTTGEDITPRDLPTVDPDGVQMSRGYMRFTAISPDGRYVVGQTLAYSYCTLIYDRLSQAERKWQFLGFTTQNGRNFTRTIPNLVEIYPTHMSPNGEWLACDARMFQRGDEFICSARYNFNSQQLEIYSDKMEDEGMKSGCIDNDGNLYSATPPESPLREFYVRHDGYWFSLRTLLQAAYNMSFTTATGFENTGTPMGVSADGRTFVGFSDPQFGENFTLRISESLVDLCEGINLLGIYTVSPATGATFSRLSQVKIVFDREVEVVGSQTAAKFGEWSSVSGNGISVDPLDPRTIVVAFRPRSLTDGQTYHFTLPAGTIAVKGDPERTNAEITADYIGRADKPVAVTRIYPADGTQLSKIDNSSLPITLTMDTQVLATPDASAAIYGSDGVRIAPLTVATGGNIVQLFPATTQYLFLGEEYTVVLEAGSLADVSGSAQNEELTIHYVGAYEREVSSDNGMLFSDDFNNISQSLATWLLYENDHNTPSTSMKEFEFTADNTPWNFSLRDNVETSDFCAASHSMYSPVGQSDDWMVIPQLYIPDNRVTLTFDAQSYLRRNNDRLKVIVSPVDEVYNFLTTEAFERLTANGTVVFDERLSPGESEEEIDNDWTSYSISLADYAGKNVYIAFVNQNNNQSMVFVDNVKVMREMPYLLSLSNKQSVINETEINIAGTFTVNSPYGFSGGYCLTLLDGEGREIDAINNLSRGIMPRGDVNSFVFTNPLPLTIGEENRFSIKVEFQEGEGGDFFSDEVKSSVKSLTFNPVKRVVLEEMTGTTCGNCPMGIIVIDRLKELYGEQFIPISIHTYDGDPWGTGLYDYSGAIGLNAAPTGVVNRQSDVLMPMITDPATFGLTMSYYGSLWMDRVAAELNEPTDIEVEARVERDEQTGKFDIPVTVRSALNASNLNLNIFLVFMEDRLVNVQHNYFAAQSDPLLGEWGLGGRYAQSTATGIVHNDVVRYAYGTSYSGTPGLLPHSLAAGEPFETTVSVQATSNYDNIDNTKFAVILVDANTDKIVNACVAYVNPVAEIQAVETRPAPSDAIYNLAGQRVADDYKGIVIRNGKKFLKR